MNGDNGRLQPLLALLTEGGVPEDVQRRLVRREEDFRRQLRRSGEAAARRHLVVRAVRWIAEGVRTMRPASKVVAAAAMVLLVVVALSWPTPSGRGSGLALADIMDRLQKVRTVSYTQTVHIGLERKAAGTMKVMEIPGRKSRVEASGGNTTIIDYQAGEMLMLDRPNKKAYITELPIEARDDGVSFLMGTSLREVKEKLLTRGVKEVELGQSIVDEKRATGFRIERTDGVWTVWADAETGLLLRAHYVFESPSFRCEETLSDFRFDEEFDDALFSLRPPAGYAVKHQALPILLGLQPDPRSLSPCGQNLKQIGIAIFMYLQAHDRQYPNSLDDLVTYLEGRRPLICPGSGEEGYIYEKPATPFLRVVEPRSVIIVYDKPGNHGGGRNVLFLDGDVQWLTEEEFQKLWAEQEGHVAPKGSASAGEGQKEGSREGR